MLAFVEEAEISAFTLKRESRRLVNILSSLLRFYVKTF